MLNIYDYGVGKNNWDWVGGFVIVFEFYDVR